MPGPLSCVRTHCGCFGYGVRRPAECGRLLVERHQLRGALGEFVDAFAKALALAGPRVRCRECRHFRDAVDQRTDAVLQLGLESWFDCFHGAIELTEKQPRLCLLQTTHA